MSNPGKMTHDTGRDTDISRNWTGADCVASEKTQGVLNVSLKVERRKCMLWERHSLRADQEERVVSEKFEARGRN